MMAKEKRRFLLSAPPGRGFRLPSESLLFQGTSEELAENHLVDTWADMVDEYADEISDEYEED